MARMRLVTDVGGLKKIDLVNHTITLGRDTSNTVCIPDPGISKHHALLVQDGNEHKMFALHSANGTWLNDERVTAARLKEGDIVRFGPIALQYETREESTPASAPRPRLAAPAPLPNPSGSEAAVTNAKK